MPIFRAKVVRHIMEHMTTLIFDDELIVGTPTNAYRGANLHPDFQSSSWYISDIDDFSTREKGPYYISPEDKATILEMLPYWEGKSMEDIADEAMPQTREEQAKVDFWRACIIQAEALITYAQLACLKGLKEQGCNGPVTEALNRLEKHLNQAAHHQEEQKKGA